MIAWYLSSGSYYTNPIIDMDFPDPCIIRASTGEFYIYATEGNGVHIQVATSRDAVNWTYIGEAMPNRPLWISKNTWAPHVMEYEVGKFYMYFAGFNTNNTLCIGIAYSTSPIGPFNDILNGNPLYCNGNLDPMAMIDVKNNSNTYLYYGHVDELDVQLLSNDHISFNNNNSNSTNNEIATLYNESLPYESVIEGSWVHYKNGYYYYYFSGNKCCGPDANYAVMIARSNVSAYGPFIKRSHSNQGYKDDVIIALNDYFYATGHNAIYTDKNNNDWIYYHGYVVGENNERKLLLDRIYYDENNWPYINTSSPSYTQQIGPVV